MKAIFASDLAGGFGYKGRLPWARVQEDMKFFMNKTSNHIIVMGRNTWNSLPQLPYRVPVVVSSIEIPEVHHLSPSTYIKDLLALEKIDHEKEIFLIGGTALLTVEALQSCEEIFHTTIKTTNIVDVKLPKEVLDYLKTLDAEVLLDTPNCTIRRHFAKL